LRLVLAWPHGDLIGRDDRVDRQTLDVGIGLECTTAVNELSR
jgi:hypothetical protein